MKKLHIVGFLIFAWSAIGQATPTISGVTGTVTHGNSITISGSGFGTKSPVKPMIWANFESGADPDSSLSRYTAWDGVYNFTRTAGVGVGGGYAMQSYTFVGQEQNFTGVIYAPIFPFNSVGQKWYLYRKSARNFAVTDDMNWKNFRPHYDPAGFYTQIGNGNLSEEASGAIGYMCPQQSPLSSTCTDSITMAQIRGNENGNWNTEQYISRSNTSGQQDGFFQYIVNGRKAIELPYFDYAQKNWYHGTGAAVDFGVVHDVSANTPDPPNGSWTKDDNIYLDDSWSRVMLSNRSTWGTASSGPLYEIQIPTAWSDTSITAQVNVGELTGGSTAYLYVVDASGTANASGYSVTIGSGGTTYTVTPSAGANGSISPNTAQTINSGSATQFTVTPNSGYSANVGGTCGGSLAGTTYTTNAITADCTVSATFADTEIPTTPADLDAYSPSASQIVFRWQPSTDNAAVTEYRVQTCAGYGCTNFSQIGTSATTSYTLSGITPSANPTIYRYRVIAADAAGNVSGNPTSVYFNATPTIPAFPGAEGGGATSKGGRGGTVYHVTNLLGDTSAGSLRACAVVATGPRTCVFDVSGNIELSSHINVSSPYLTIAGHTAPGGGITVSGKNSTAVSFTARTHNIIVRGIRFRKGYNAGTPSQDGDSANVAGVSATSGPIGPIIFDHISASWGQDENAEVWSDVARAPKNITYQWSMIYEPLLAHPVNLLTGASSSAVADNMTDLDLHHSILANSSHRNPMIKTRSFRVVNSLVYNWSDWALAVHGTGQVDIIGNKFKTGPLYLTESAKAYEIEATPIGNSTTATTGTTSIYVTGNVGPHNLDPLADNWVMTRLIDLEINGSAELGPLSESYRRLTPLPALPFPITAQDVASAETAVLAGAGASRRLDCAGNWVSNRDSADTRVVAEYTAGNAGIVPINEDAVGGYPTLAAGTACTDTDGDGMPDTWETANGLNASSASDGPTLHASGYSNLEMYLAGPSSETTPVLSNLLPTSNLARTATSATLQATTDQIATCRYALGSGIPYAGMTLFSNTASTTHSSSVSVVAGGVYQYCVRCMGTSLVSDESCTRFAVDPNPKKRVRH